MVAIVLLVIAAGATVAGITLLAASSKARGWPVVPGRIVERTVGPSTTTGASRPGRYVGSQLMWTPEAGSSQNHSPRAG